MDRLLKTAAFLVIAIAITISCSWTGTFHLTWGAAVVPLSVLAYWLVRRRYAYSAGDHTDADEHTPPAVSRSIMIGAASGVLFSLGLAGWFWTLHQIPSVYAGYYDRDRESLESQLSTLENAENHERAAQLLVDRLEKRLSPEWETLLAGRLYENLVKAGRKRAIEMRGRFYSKAIHVADKYGLDATLARSLQEHDEAELSFRSKLRGIERSKNWRRLVESLRGAILRYPDSHEFPQRLYNAYMRWAEATDDIDEKHGLYSKARAVAHEHALPGKSAASAAGLTSTIIDSRRNYTAGCRARAELAQRNLVAMFELAAQSTALVPDLDDKLTLLRPLSKVGASSDVGRDRLRKVDRTIEAVEHDITARRELSKRVHAITMSNSAEYIKAMRNIVRNTDPRHWAQPYDRVLLQALLSWGNDGRDLVEQEARFREVIRACRECNIDPGRAAERLQVIELEMSRRKRIERQIASLRKQGEFSELTSFVRFQMLERDRAQWGLRFDQELFSALLTWAETKEDLQSRLRLYLQARDVNQKYGLPHAAALAGRIRRTKSAIQVAKENERRRTAPVTLPTGTRATVHSIYTEALPAVLAIDVCVSDKDGSAITDLKPKDFSVEVDGLKQDFCINAVRSRAIPAHVVLALDTSGSVAGEPLKAIKRGSIAFVRTIVGQQIQVKLLSFNAKVETGSWSGDQKELTDGINKLSANGGTALFQAVATAADALKGRRGDRFVVIFSDGKDSIGGVKTEDALMKCKEAGIRVLAIGLKTAELDDRFLRKLTSETGGTYSAAANTTEILKKYLLASNRVQKRLYRIGILLRDRRSSSGTHSVNVTIGGKNHVTLTTEAARQPLQTSRATALPPLGSLSTVPR